MCSPGQAGDSPVLPELLDELCVARLGPGRRRTRPDALLSAKAHSARAHRDRLRDCKVTVVIPERADQVRNRHNRGSAGGRPIKADKLAEGAGTGAAGARAVRPAA